LLTAGLGFTHYEEDAVDVTEVNPKLGLQYWPVPAVQLRAAAFRSVKGALTVNQTVEPTQIAAFPQFLDDTNGTTSDTVAAGLDVELASNVYAGLEGGRRWSTPRLDSDNEQIDLRDHEDFARSYLYLVLDDRLTATLDLYGSKFDRRRNDAGGNPDQIDTLLGEAGLRYFDPRGPFATASVGVVGQRVHRPAADDGPSGSDIGPLLNLAVGYRLPGGRGLVSIEASNLLDQQFSYHDQRFRTTERVDPPFQPERTILVRAYFTF
jgi:hypothetical protein